MPLTNFWLGLATNTTAGGDKQLNIPTWALCWKLNNNYELNNFYIFHIFIFLNIKNA